MAKGVAATFTRENVALFFLSVAFSRTRVRRQWRFPRSQEYEQYRGWQQISRLQCDHGLYLLIALSFFSLSLSWKEEKQFHRRVFDTLFDHISSLSRYNFRRPTRDNNFNLITNTTFQVNNSRGVKRIYPPEEGWVCNHGKLEWKHMSADRRGVN